MLHVQITHVPVIMAHFNMNKVPFFKGTYGNPALYGAKIIIILKPHTQPPNTHLYVARIKHCPRHMKGNSLIRSELVRLRLNGDLIGGGKSK